MRVFCPASQDKTNQWVNMPSLISQYVHLPVIETKHSSEKQAFSPRFIHHIRPSRQITHEVPHNPVIQQKEIKHKVVKS